MAQKGRGCGCVLAVLVVVAVVASIAGWRILKPRWDAARERSLPDASGKEMQIHVLDVGLGDAILIVAPSGKTILVDAGVPGSGKKILDAMRRYNIDHLDYFVATHGHADHIGAADEVIRGTNVGAVLTSNQSYPTKEFESFVQSLKEKKIEPLMAAPGVTYDLEDGCVLSVLGPSLPPFGEAEMRTGGNVANANSVVLRLDYGRFSIFLAGDAETQTEQRMLRSGTNVSATILKVGHHGSKYATSPEFLKGGAFKAAVISTSADNRYGLPGQETLDRLKAAGVKLYRTDMQGEITITTRGDEQFNIQTAREPKPNDNLWVGREAIRDDSERRGFIDFGDLPPAPRPKQEANSRTTTNGR